MYGFVLTVFKIEQNASYHNYIDMFEGLFWL